jgi:hypothetical protein
MKSTSKLPLSLLAAGILCLATTGCGLLDRNSAVPPGSDKSAGTSDGAAANTPPVPARTTQVDIEKLDTARAHTGIELILEIPREPVDRYVVNYGFEKDKLDSHLEIKISDFEKLEYNEKGYVYRYVIETLPNDRTIYMSLVSMNGEKASAPSEIFEVLPETRL